jgi:uncharacterized protein YdhG (YjbR/CyaY superfamily)
MAKPESIEEYLDGFPGEAGVRLRAVRAAIVAEVTRLAGTAPVEKVRYGMGAVMLDDRTAFHYAGWKNHIGLYPVHVLPDALESEVAGLRAAKDTVQLVHARPLPLELVTRITAEVFARYRA